MKTACAQLPDIMDFKKAADQIKGVVRRTPLQHNRTYSKKCEAQVYFKREDLQLVRSYKIRGAYNKISSLSESERTRGIVCASAGNHAQGVAYACNELKLQGTIYMPTPTPKQKIEQVKMFGEGYIDIQLAGDTFDDAYTEARKHADLHNQAFVHPFNDPKIIEGQGTVGLEMIEQSDAPLDYVFVPIGGGGLSAGVSAVLKTLSPQTKIIGVEPAGAPSMSTALKNGQVTRIHNIDKFVDGAAVQEVGHLNFDICKDTLDDVVLIEVGHICQTILDLYNRDAIVVEPAGALSIAALDLYKDKIKGKTVACVVSGSNNDITRMAEIKERALLYSQLKHYFIINFPQRAGALKEFVMEVLGPNDDITFFEYSKKTSRENGPAVVGIELESQADLSSLMDRMKTRNFFGEYLNDKPELFRFVM